jgi:regulator of sigma E protease
VKVEHLKGPVGIAHLGTLVAERGFIWLLFFMALISINLAVINFLPLPIVDGGQFLFLVYEQIRGKPVPPGFQNVVTMAGLVLIGCVFLIVTYNDITHLFGL